MARIGSEVETISGEAGVLICSSGMGLSPMDLFNDILTNRQDLENFVGDCNFKETDNISLRSVFMTFQGSKTDILHMICITFTNSLAKNLHSIKAYLKFCKITKTPYWMPNDTEIIAVGDCSFEMDLYEDRCSNDDFSRPFYDVKG